MFGLTETAFIVGTVQENIHTFSGRLFELAIIISLLAGSFWIFVAGNLRGSFGFYVWSVVLLALAAGLTVHYTLY